MDPMAYEGETASPDHAFSDDSSCSTPSGGSNQLDNRLQVVIWLKEHYRVGEAGSMRKSFVYQHYLDACRESGMEGAPISHTFFGKLVRRAFPGIKCNRKGPRGDAHQCYTHLEKLPTAQRLGAWQVEQITEELSKCSSSGSPTGSRLSPLRPKTSPRPRDTDHHHHPDHDDEVPSTPTSDDHAHHQQPRRHQHRSQHDHQGRQCFSSCCSPLSSPPIAFSTSASTSSSFSSSPRSSCCPEEGECHHVVEDAPSCCSGHHHPGHHSHYHPSSSSSSSSGGESYASYHPDEQLSLLPQQQQQQHYLPDLAYAAPAFFSYPAFYGHPATYSYSPSAADYHAQQQQLQLHHQYPQSASPTFDLSTTGEEEVEEEFGVGNVTALASPRLGNGMALTFADYLTACQTAREQQQQQQPLHTSATIAEGEFETDRVKDEATASWSVDGCSRTEPFAAWASTAWSDAIY